MSGEAETRWRLELGASARVAENVAARIAFGTGADGAPADAEMRLGEPLEDRPLRLRIAEIEWSPSRRLPSLQWRGGKLNMPFLRPSRLVWDEDIRPEGVIARWTRAGESLDVFGLAGAFQLENEAGGERRELFAAQTAVRTRLPNRHWAMAGAGAYAFDEAPDHTPLRPIEAFGVLGLELYFPVQAVVHVTANPEADRARTAWLTGVSMGRTKAVYGIELGAEWLRIERHALAAAFADDAYGGGTDRQERRLTLRSRLSPHLLAGFVLSREKAPIASDTGTWRIGLELQADL